MKKIFKKLFKKTDVDPHHLFLMVLYCDTWHNNNMPRVIFDFLSK